MFKKYMLKFKKVKFKNKTCLPLDAILGAKSAVQNGEILHPPGPAFSKESQGYSMPGIIRIASVLSCQPILGHGPPHLFLNLAKENKVNLHISE